MKACHVTNQFDVCYRCREGAPCEQHRDFEVVELKLTHSHGMRWDSDGRCFETVDKGPEARRPDMDFGTPNGDLLIDPWVQDAVKKSQ